MLIQSLINGLAAGSIYALIALGLAIIYRTSHVLNFGHTEQAMFSTFIAYYFIVSVGINPWLAVLLTISCAMLIGFCQEFLVIRQLRQKKVPPGVQILITLGFYMAFHGMASWIWGVGTERFPRLYPEIQLHITGTFVSLDAVIILLVTCIIMICLYSFFKFTMAGIAMRAMSENLRASLLMGVNVNLIFLLAWGIAAALGAIAGILVVPITFLHTTMMLPVLLKALAGAVLGGFDSYPGIVLGSLAVGVMDSLIGVYVNLELRMVFAFILITVVLFVRPTGIFGVREGRRV